MTEAITILQPETEDAQTLAGSIVERAKIMTVTTDGGYKYAGVMLAEIASARKGVVGLFKEPKQAAHRAHKTVTAAEKKLLGPLDDARVLVSAAMWSYDEAKRLEAAKIQREAEAAARKADEERRLADALAAEDAGDADLAEQILDEPPMPAPVAVAPATPKVEGVSTTTRWRAQVEDLSMLIRYVAENPQWTHLLKWDQVALNGLARSQRGELRLPGVRAVPVTGHAVRS